MPYRDDVEAARHKRDQLRRELEDIDDQLARSRAMAKQRAAVAASLDEASRELDRARGKVALPLLSRVQVASPCHARWDDMKGDERVRHCGACDKEVYDLSAMSSEQAEALLQAHGTSLCARFYRRRDGTVMTSDCAPGARRALVRDVALGAASALMLGTSFVSVVGGAAYLYAVEHESCGIGPPETAVMGAVAYVPEEPVMGEIAYVPDPVPEPAPMPEAPEAPEAPDE